MTSEVITKLDAACRQLELAIHLYFEKGDQVAIHTLSCAAREIFEKHCDKSCCHRLFDDIQKRHHGTKPTELWNVLNRARNFFKHPDAQGNLDATIELDPDDNKLMMFMAAHDCGSLLNEATPALFKRYITWVIGTEPFYRQMFPEINQYLDGYLAGLDRVSSDIQWEIGKMLVMLTMPDGTPAQIGNAPPERTNRRG